MAASNRHNTFTLPNFKNMASELIVDWIEEIPSQKEARNAAYEKWLEEFTQQDAEKETRARQAALEKEDRLLMAKIAKEQAEAEALVEERRKHYEKVLEKELKFKMKIGIALSKEEQELAAGLRLGDYAVQESYVPVASVSSSSAAPKKTLKKPEVLLFPRAGFPPLTTHRAHLAQSSSSYPVHPGTSAFPAAFMRSTDAHVTFLPGMEEAQAKKLFAEGLQLLHDLVLLETENHLANLNYNPTEEELERELSFVRAEAEAREKAFAFMNGSYKYLKAIESSVVAYRKLVAEQKAKQQEMTAKKQAEESLEEQCAKVFAQCCESLQIIRRINKDSSVSDTQLLKLTSYFASHELENLKNMVIILDKAIQDHLKAEAEQFEHEQQLEKNRDACEELYKYATTLNDEVHAMTGDSANANKNSTDLTQANASQDFSKLETIISQLQELKTRFTNDLNQQYALGVEYAKQIATREKSPEKAIACMDALDEFHKTKNLKELMKKVAALSQELYALVLAKTTAKAASQVESGYLADENDDSDSEEEQYVYSNSTHPGFTTASAIVAGLTSARYSKRYETLQDDSEIEEYSDYETENEAQTSSSDKPTKSMAVKLPKTKRPVLQPNSNGELELQTYSSNRKDDDEVDLDDNLDSSDRLGSPVHQAPARRTAAYLEYNNSNQNRANYGLRTFDSALPVIKQIGQVIDKPDSSNNKP